MENVSRSELVTIGQLAGAAGVTRKAVRVWIAKGILAPADRTHAGYQLFTADTVRIAAFVRRAQALGLGLDAIARILQARNGSAAQPCETVRELLAQRIEEIDAVVAHLLALRADLSSAAAAEVSDPDAVVCDLIEHGGDGVPVETS